ncbi:MAG: hypothetical protein LBT95_01355, partial [Treponema sp.]|nr:hypothetical protein [Treponema sp.]
PQDTLSSQLIAFFRYFSLPLEGEALSKLRRDILLFRAALPEAPPRDRGLHSPAAVLGAVAAADKGVSLSPEALMEYAAAIDPEKGQSGQGGTENSPDQGHPNSRERGEGDPADEDREDSGEEIRDPGKLREKFETLGVRRPLLDLLNRIPGKDGRRWILFPFTFESGGVAIRVSVRILLKDAGGGARLILDILGKKRRWLFCLSGYEIARSRAYVGISPPLSRQGLKLLKEGLGKALEGIAGEIHLENREERFPVEGEIQEGPLWINEKV